MKLRVLTYNIHKGFSTSGLDFTLHAIKAALKVTQADILLLQEVVGENQQHQKAIANWPKESQFEFLADSVWPHYSYGKNAVFSLRNHGNAILSRFPIVKEENINISNNAWEQRGLLHCEISIPDLHKTLHIFNTHIDLWESGRRKQFEKILARARSHLPGDVPFLFGGDFNDWTTKLNPLLIEHLGVSEAHTQLYQKPAKSFPSHFPILPLDRLYFRHMQVRDCSLLKGHPWNTLSDHLPLLAEFDI